MAGEMACKTALPDLGEKDFLYGSFFLVAFCSLVRMESRPYFS